MEELRRCQCHAGEVLGPGLLRSILRAVELTVDDLLKWL